VAREPGRPAREAASAPPSLVEVLRLIGAEFRMLGAPLLAAGLCQVPPGALAAWLPTYASTRFGMTVEATGYLFGPLTLAATALGVIVVPAVADRLVRRGRIDGVAMTGGFVRLRAAQLLSPQACLRR
jgi:hypothetical protein